MKPYAIEAMQQNDALRGVGEKKETVWINPRLLPFEATDPLCQLIVSDRDIRSASDRLARFAPFIRKRSPETAETDGVIESPLRPIPAMRARMEAACRADIPGRLLLKMDSHLAIAGSVKARGGIYEVLKHAETLAIAAGKLAPGDDYAKLASDEMRRFFGGYTVQVGSTGNLGLSIGIAGAALGFRARVHMSADAKQWKKDLLRSKGVEVVEYADDYSHAVSEGRRLSDLDPNSYFVDDENSVDLFLGYAVAALRLQKQLAEQDIPVDASHPLIVYLPAGVGGAPGGIAYGLKRVFKDDVHCFFTEPVKCPSVLLGFATGMYEKANVHDFDISGITDADGLACASPSGFVTRIDANLVSGAFTVADGRLYDFMRMLADAEGIRIEPSSCAAFIGPSRLTAHERGRAYLSAHGLDAERLRNCTQICWATGGSLVPEPVWDVYMNTFK